MRIFNHNWLKCHLSPSACLHALTLQWQRVGFQSQARFGSHLLGLLPSITYPHHPGVEAVPRSCRPLSHGLGTRSDSSRGAEEKPAGKVQIRKFVWDSVELEAQDLLLRHSPPLSGTYQIMLMTVHPQILMVKP